MNNQKVKLIMTGIALIVVVYIAVKILKFAIAILLPVAVVAVIAFLIYTFIVKRR